MVYRASPYVSSKDAREQLRKALLNLADLAARAEPGLLELRIKMLKSILGQVKYSVWNENTPDQWPGAKHGDDAAK